MKYRKMYNNAKSIAYEFLNRKVMMPPHNNGGERMRGSLNFPSGFNKNKLNNGAKGTNNCNKKNSGKIKHVLVPAIQLSPFGDKFLPTSGLADSMVQISNSTEKEGEMNAKISAIRSPGMQFDVSNLTGWEDV
jgi:hypothetical protein